MRLQLAVLAALALMPAAPVQAQTYGDQPPPGDYWRTCRNINLDGYGGSATISATCRDDRGRSRSTSLAFTACNGPVTNRDGQLACVRNSYYPPNPGRPGDNGYTQGGGYYSGGNGGYYGGGGYSPGGGYNNGGYNNGGNYNGGYSPRPGSFAPGAITLYSGPQFQGPAFTLNREITNLPRQYNDQAMSLRVQGGAWQICADSDFEGRCQVVDRDVPNLNDLGLGEAISSIRQVR